MSVLAAVVNEGNLYLASDRYVGTDGHYTTLATPKYVVRKNLLIGFCGDLAVLNKIQYDLDTPTQGPLLWNTVKAVKDIVGEDDEYELLLYSGGTLATSSHHGELMYCDYIAIGSGSDYALGALHYMLGTELKNHPLQAVTAAVHVASQLHPNVKPPVDTIVFKSDGTYFEPSTYKQIAFIQ